MDIYEIHHNELNRQKFDKELFYTYLLDARKGDNKAREKAITYSLGLIISTVKEKFKVPVYELEDIIMAGIPGLINAIDKYDIKRGNEFSTFASKCIFNEIYTYLNRNNKHKEILSLSMKLNSEDEESMTLEEIIADENTKDTFDILYRKIENDKIMNIINKLPEKDKLILEMYFGLNGHKRHIQSKIADYFGVRKTTISKRIKKLLNNIKKELIKGSKTFNDRIDLLSDTLKITIELYYGLNGKNAHSVKEISNILKVNKSTVYRNLQKALSKLKDNENLNYYEENIKRLEERRDRMIKTSSFSLKKCKRI